MYCTLSKVAGDNRNRQGAIGPALFDCIRPERWMLISAPKVLFGFRNEDPLLEEPYTRERIDRSSP